MLHARRLAAAIYDAESCELVLEPPQIVDTPGDEAELIRQLKLMYQPRIIVTVSTTQADTLAMLREPIGSIRE